MIKIKKGLENGLADYQQSLQSINSGVKRITSTKPVDAIKLKEVNENHVSYKRPVGLKEERLPSGVKVRYLYASGELEGGNRESY